MQIVLLILSFIFLGIIPPVFLIAIASPWSFASILTGWTAFAVVFYPLGWLALGRKRLV